MKSTFLFYAWVVFCEETDHINDAMFKNHMHGPLVTYKRWQPGAPLPRLPTDGGAVFGISNIPDESLIPSDESINRIHKTKHVKNQNYHDPAENGFKENIIRKINDFQQTPFLDR